MLFNSHVFLFLFLPTFLLGWRLTTSRDRRLWWLIGCSLVFYGWFSPPLVALLLASVQVDYVAGQRMAATTRANSRRAWLAFSLLFNLGALGWFKYAAMAGATADFWMGRSTELTEVMQSVVLPIGISFYTFQTLSYSIDVYRRRIEPAASLAEFAAYVTFFPQLVAGPIVRFDDLRAPLQRLDEPVSADVRLDGWGLVVLGLARKVLVADPLGRMVDPLWARAPQLGGVEAWLAVFGFGLQLYNDFAAYTDIARGLGQVLGVPLPVNFDSPWRATSVSDFWRRWHISLSTWFRDYVYIPLGGGRRGTLQVSMNLMVTMALCGAWHGARWTFVAWGIYHGLLLVIHRVWVRSSPVRLPEPLPWLLTLVTVMAGWVFFRSPDWVTVGHMVRALVFRPGLAGEIPLDATTLGWILLALLAAVVGPNSNQLVVPRRPVSVLLLLILAWVAVLRLGSGEPFAYFQF
jgi:alginate O-acetyltransferase complex protein AlgI